MDDYTAAAFLSSRAAMEQFSTSFSLASRLFGTELRSHVCNIYGLVRIADEIVDTYGGPDQLSLLNDLEAETYWAIERGYSSNLVVHAFAITAARYGIDQTLIAPFFESMRIDANHSYKIDQYQTYIYGSAEVVGLMCLKIFVESDDYAPLVDGARSLGSAFQKVNFLRDLHEDWQQLQRYYFPVGSYEQFNDAIKQQIVADIKQDFIAAEDAIIALPSSSRRAVKIAYSYYRELLTILERTPAETLKQQRIRLPNRRKLTLLVAARLSR